MDVQRESDSSGAVYKCKIVFNENLYTRLQITLSITYMLGGQLKLQKLFRQCVSNKNIGHIYVHHPPLYPQFMSTAISC